MTEYQIIIHKKIQAFIKELQPSYQDKIREILKTLGSNPFAYPYVKIRGEEQIFRIRCPCNCRKGIAHLPKYGQKVSSAC